MAILKCPECGNENVSDKHQCDICGCPLSELSVCPDCSQTNINSAENCIYCGCPLKSQKKKFNIKIKKNVIAVILATVIAIIGILTGISKEKKEFTEELISKGLWQESGTTAKISFRDNGVIVYSIVNVTGGVLGDMNYLIIPAKYEVKLNNRIKIGDKTLKVIFTQDGKIDFKPSLRPVITEAANNLENEGE